MKNHFADDTERLSEMFRAFHHMSIMCVDREIARRGLGKLNNPKIMFTLKHRAGGEPVPQKQIADWIGVAPPTVAVSVKRLEKAGLVRKTVNREDLRENCIELTEEGRSLTDACEEVVRQVHHRIFSDLTDDEKKALISYMTRMLGTMEEMGVRHPQIESGTDTPA